MAPYVHKVSHRVKKVGERHQVPVLLSAPKKAERLCGIIDRGVANAERSEKTHKKLFVACEVGYVYKMPLSCGKHYIGQ